MSFKEEAARIRQIEDPAELDRAVTALFARYRAEQTPEERWFSDMVERALRDRAAIPRLRREVRRSAHPGADVLLETFDMIEGRTPRI